MVAFARSTFPLLATLVFASAAPAFAQTPADHARTRDGFVLRTPSLNQ
jgi:hypothetical protein